MKQIRTAVTVVATVAAEPCRNRRRVSSIRSMASSAGQEFGAQQDQRDRPADPGVVVVRLQVAADAALVVGDDEDAVARATSEVVRLAVRASNAIGNGLYGVDLKVVKDRPVIIEVNDNPSIDAGVEDAYLGEDLYRRIMGEFLRRLERKRLGVRD